MDQEEHTIDATNQSIGRVSSQAAKLLMGKHRPDYQPNTVAPVRVAIINVSKARVPLKKRREVEYLSYSGYPGGQTRRSMQQVIDTKGYAEVFRRAVYGMLPANRLRKPRLKQLTIEE